MDFSPAGCGFSLRRNLIYKKCISCQQEKSLDRFGKTKNGCDIYCRECRNKISKQWYKDNPIKTKKQRRERREYSSNWGYLKRHGISKENFLELLRDQKYKCAICFNEITGDKKSHLDHNHDTNKLRGILCQPCNMGLGLFKDKKTNLINAVTYLERYE